MRERGVRNGYETTSSLRGTGSAACTPGADIAAITDLRDSNKSQSFPLYDNQDRLWQAQGPYGTQGYIYDALGNVLTKAAAT